ncbi:MAG: tyrosine-type recombinase/integrase [Spirochaetota bacterium]|nr:tyrosine-type recombinase/integrase [Spirochaetota bacterium]
MLQKENQYIRHFLDVLIYEKQYSSNTLKAYQTDIESFVQFSIHHDFSWIEASPCHISSWLEFLSKLKLSPKSIARKLSSLRSLFIFLIKSNIIDKNPFVLFSSPKLKKTIPTTLSQIEIFEIFHNMPIQNVLERRNKAMLILMYATGIRSEELCSLQHSDVKLSNNTIKVLGKGKKERIVPLIPKASEIIESWLEDRKILNQNLSSSLFLSKNGHKLTTAMIRKIVQNFSSMIPSTIAKTFHAHAFRYTFATHLLENQANLRHIQELLGHASLSVTQNYTTISITNLQKKFKQFHPRAK